MATSTFTQLLSSEWKSSVQCCFTSTETVRTIRDGEPRTSTSTFTQFLSSEKTARATVFYYSATYMGSHTPSLEELQQSF